MYISPETVCGVGVSLSIPFKAILGGMFTLWGPVIGSAIIVSLEEYIRAAYGGTYTSVSQIIYGIALLLLIMFLPKGIFGTLKEKFQKK
jgi:branched-chain amino acid transport system permease protein